MNLIKVIENGKGDVSDDDLPDVMGLLGAAAGGDAKVLIYRHVDGAKLGYCETVQLAVFTNSGLDYIQRKWGEGDYRLQVHGKKEGAARAGILRSFDICVVAPQQKVMDMPSMQQSDAGLVSVVGDLVLAMRQQAQRDPWADMVRAKELFAPAQNPYATITPSSSNGVEKMMEMVMMMQGLGQLKAVMADTFGNVEPDKRGDMMRALGGLVGSLPALAAAHNNPIHSPPAPAPAMEVPAPAHEPDEITDFAEAAKAIADKIKGGADAETVVYWIWDNCGEGVIAGIADFDAMLEAVYVKRYSLDSYKALVGKVVAAIREEYHAD